MQSDVHLLFTLALLAGAVALDTTSAFQVMISQPLVAGTLAGVVAGDPGLGLAIGAALQLVWIAVVPVGGAPFPDAAVGSVTGVGLAVLLSRHGVSEGAALFCGMLLSFGAAAIGQRCVSGLRRLNETLAARALSTAEKGDARGVSAAVRWALGARFVSAFAISLPLMAAGLAALTRIPALHLPGSAAIPLWTAPVGAAAIAVSSRGPRERWLMGAGFAAGMVLVVAL